MESKNIDLKEFIGYNGDMDFLEADLKNMNSSFDLMFGKPITLSFLDIKFDFTISPDHFLGWLAEEGEEITGDYRMDCSSMCEYSCLYIGMLLYNTDFEGKMEVMSGNVGFFDHYWIQYTYKGEQYFIDLTLKQFLEDAPKLSITKAMNEKVAGGYNYYDDEDEPNGIEIREYVDSKKGFQFYANPQSN